MNSLITFIRHQSTSPTGADVAFKDCAKWWAKSETIPSFMMKLIGRQCNDGQQVESPHVLLADDILTVKKAITCGCKWTEPMIANKNVWTILGEMGSYGVRVSADDFGFMRAQKGPNVWQDMVYKTIKMLGTAQHKMKWLPDLASGKRIGGFCVNDNIFPAQNISVFLAIGLDFVSIKTRAVLSPDGKHYILNGSKIFESNERDANLFVVWVKMPVTFGSMANKISAVLVVERGPGVTLR
ncbi:unnamed protein product, partial [Medioppia subpectinata]